MKNNLTIKQESFCQAYIRLGDKSAAYREAYSCENMKPETIHERSSRLSNEYKISTRIEALQDEVKKRNDITIDEIVSRLADMLDFDLADLYDSNGILKNIHSIPKKARLMIAQLDTDEIVLKNKFTGQSKKVKIFDKLNVIEKLMKHLGGYEKDNRQKETIVNIAVSKEEIKQISEELENEV